MGLRRRALTRKSAATCLVALLAVPALAACTTTTQLTPWFRVESHRPLLDQPVEIGGAAHDVAWMRIGGQWVQVADGKPFATRARDGRAVLFRRAGRWQIARESGEIAALEASCAFPALHPTTAAVYCARCANQPIASDCRGAVLTEMDLSGRVVRELRTPEPTAAGAFGLGLLAALPDGTIVLSTAGACRLFAVSGGGTRVLADRSPRARCDRFDDWSADLGSLEAVPLVRSEPSAH